jgi:hypothetical protein
VPVRTCARSGGVVVHRAALSCHLAAAVRCSGALLRSSAGPGSRARRGEGRRVWCVGLRARCAFRAVGGVELWLVCSGSSWRFGLGERGGECRGAGGLKKFGWSIGKSDRWPGFTFQREKPRWNGTGGPATVTGLRSGSAAWE